jgi:hypothetical protein
MKKQILLTALTLALLTSAVTTAAAEEVVATIVSEPKSLYGGSELIYDLDTMPGDGIIDRSLGISYSSITVEAFVILPRYLKEGWKVVYENDGLKSFEGFGFGRLTDVISPDGIHIDLTELFHPAIIQYRFPYLDRKLRAQGATSR